VPVGGLHPGPVPTQQSQAGTILFVRGGYLAADEKLKGEVGRKAMVLIHRRLSTPTGSRTTIAKAIEAAQKADSIIYRHRL